MTAFQHQPPVAGVTEIRVHGVGGTSPAAMLGRSDLVQVAGDDISGFYRSASTEGGHAVEAYSWGGLTARSAARALWVLMLPFSLVNLAGWMIEPVRERVDRSPGRGVFAAIDKTICRIGKVLPAKTSVGLERVQRFLVHLLGLAFTATYVQLAAFLAVDLFATQCGGNDACRDRLPLRSILGSTPEVGRRLVFGMAVPVALVVLFLYLARRSRLSYESYRPQGGAPLDPSKVSPLEDPLVWDRVGYQKLMASLHASACVGGLLLTLSGTVRDLVAGGRSSLSVFGIAAGLVLTVTSVVLVAWISARGSAEDRDWQTVARVVFWGGWIALVVELVAVWGLNLEGPVPPSQWFSWTPLLLLSVAIGIGALLAAAQAIRWVAECYLHSDQFLVVLAALAVALFPRASVLAAAASLLLLVNLATKSEDGRRTGLLDLVVLNVTSLIGFGVARLSDEPAYLWMGVAVSAVVASLIWLARRPEDGFRWAGSGAMGAFSAMIMLGIFSGLILRVARWLSDEDFQITYPAFYNWAVVAVTLTLAVVAFGLVLYLVRLLVIKGRTWFEEAKSRLSNAGYPKEVVAHPSLKSTLFRAVVNGVKTIDVVITLAGTILFAAGLAGAVKMIKGGFEFAEWFNRPFPENWPWLLDLAAWLSVSAVVGAYLMVRSGLRNEATRHKIGVVWDVASFFPRSFHPLAPPTYAARAIPEIQARIREVVESKGSVLLAGHSQGSVIAASVVASLPDDIARKTALVTYGSPLGTFYRPYFPVAFPPEMMQRLAAKTGVGDSLCWANFYRVTDPVSSPAYRTGDAGGRQFAKAVTDVLNRSSRPSQEGDVELDDPWETEVIPFRPVPPVRVHMGYESDPAWSGTIKALVSLF